MEPGEGAVVKVVSGVHEAEIVCGLLRSAGIECAYRDTPDIETTLEEFTQAGPQEIIVPESDVEAARQLLAGAAG